MAKKKMYTFSERRHSRKGITSTVLGSISVVIFIVSFAALPGVAFEIIICCFNSFCYR